MNDFTHDIAISNKLANLYDTSTTIKCECGVIMRFFNYVPCDFICCGCNKKYHVENIQKVVESEVLDER